MCKLATSKHSNTIKNLEQNTINSQMDSNTWLMDRYKEIYEERRRLRRDLSVFRIFKKATEEEIEKVQYEDDQNFANFLCDLLTVPKFTGVISAEYMQILIIDFLKIYDYIEEDVANLTRKANTIEYVLKNHKLYPEDIDKLIIEQENAETRIREIINFPLEMVGA